MKTMIYIDFNVNIHRYRWYNSTIKVLWNGTQVFHYQHKSPLIFYYFSLAVERGGWATWAANCIPSGECYVYSYKLTLKAYDTFDRHRRRSRGRRLVRMGTVGMQRKLQRWYRNAKTCVQ